MLAYHAGRRFPMLRSLRGTLALFWVFVVVVCGALALQLYGLFELGIGGEITQAQQSVERAATGLKKAFDLYVSSFSVLPANFDGSDGRHELRLLLDLVLGQYYGIEGGFWSPQSK